MKFDVLGSPTWAPIFFAKFTSSLMKEEIVYVIGKHALYFFVLKRRLDKMGKHVKNHLDALDDLDAQINKMNCQGYSINEINQSVIGRCLIEMNGILACIADSLENLEKEVRHDGKVQ